MLNGFLGTEAIGKLREHVFLMAWVLILLLILFSGARNGTQGLTQTRGALDHWETVPIPGTAILDF